jgi:hypothetical protein
MYSAEFIFNPQFLSKCDIFHQNVDGNMKVRYSLIVIDHQIDEKTSNFDQNEVERRMSWSAYGSICAPQNSTLNPTFCQM